MPRKRNTVSTHIQPIPVPSKANHPPNPEGIDCLPNHEFTMGLIAPKGSGKTTLMINLLRMYKGYFNKIIIFSPTITNDEKWDWVKEQPLLAENTKLAEFIERMKLEESDTTEVVGMPRKSESLGGLLNLQTLAGGEERVKGDEFDGKIPEECFMTEYSEETLDEIITQQQQLVDLLKECGQTRHLADRILFLFDDLVGSNLFSNTRKNSFKVLNTTHRHLSSSILMVSQAYKEIIKTVRTQFSCLILFEIWSDAELAAIYDDNQMGMCKDDWLSMYRKCVEGPYNFLFYNTQQEDRQKKVMKNFETYIAIGTDQHGDGIKNEA